LVFEVSQNNETLPSTHLDLVNSAMRWLLKTSCAVVLMSC
jgi:hypothetical protein